MKDIVEELREMAGSRSGCESDPAHWFMEAAKEIEKLRDWHATAQKDIDDLDARCVRLRRERNDLSSRLQRIMFSVDTAGGTAVPR